MDQLLPVLVHFKYYLRRAAPQDPMSNQSLHHDFQGNKKVTTGKDQTYKKTLTAQLPH